VPGRSDPWRLAATSLIAVSVLVVVLVTLRGGGATTKATQSSTTAATMSPPDRLGGPLPPPRGGGAMAFDTRLDEVVLFGGSAVDNGSGSPPALTDTWVLHGRRWAERNPAIHPPAMVDELMVFDATSQTCVLVGVPSSTSGPGSAVEQETVETWGWDGTSWTRFSDLRFSSTENLQGVAADPTTGHPLLVTAPNAGPPVLHTWTWDGHQWMLQRRADPFPERATRPSLASIDRSPPNGRGPGVLMLFGTATGTETWFWVGVTWSKEADGPTPPYTPLSATMAGDPTDGTVVLISLADAGSSSTWVWDGSVWNEGTRAPNVDSFYGATFALTDTSTAHPIVIGDQPNQLDMIWTWDGQNWVTDRGV
jgi:hypothetical protein